MSIGGVSTDLFRGIASYAYIDIRQKIVSTSTSIHIGRTNRYVDHESMWKLETTVHVPSVRQQSSPTHLFSELASKSPMTDALRVDVRNPYPFLTRICSMWACLTS